MTVKAVGVIRCGVPYAVGGNLKSVYCSLIRPRK